MNKEILNKYLNNTCSDEEFEELVNWVKTESGDKYAKYWSFNQWKLIKPEFNEKANNKFSALLDKIHHEINLKQREIQESKNTALLQVSKWFSSAAAILVIPLLGIIFYLISNNNFENNTVTELAVDTIEVIAPVGSRTVVQLSDGTEVNLNYGSRIKYPRIFTGNTREITLSGEAYFDVAYKKDKPFIVKSGNLNVMALGTEFDVQSYPDDNSISVTLVEGKVMIERVIPYEQNDQVGTMIPGQHLMYNLDSGEILSSVGSVDKYIAWKDGKLILDNEPITKVAEKLERMFNVDIEVVDAVRYLSYTVTFFDDPLYLILDLMTETTPISYKVLPRKKLSDGSFSQQKIIIEKSK